MALPAPPKDPLAGIFRISYTERSEGSDVKLLPRAELMSFTLSPHEVEHSPSREDGVSAAEERTLRAYGCEVIQQAGMLLRLPQVVIANAQILFHRFYHRRSLRQVSVLDVAPSVVFLACKVEEEYRKLRQIIFVFHRLLQRREGISYPITVELGSPAYFQFKTSIINMEQVILRELSFTLHVNHSHKYVLLICGMLGETTPCVEGRSALSQTAWDIANDSLRTDLCVRFPAEAIAVAALHLASRVMNKRMPESWWTLFGVEKNDLEDICTSLVEAYNMPAPTLVNLAPDPKTERLTVFMDVMNVELTKAAKHNKEKLKEEAERKSKKERKEKKKKHSDSRSRSRSRRKGSRKERKRSRSRGEKRKRSKDRDTRRKSSRGRDVRSRDRGEKKRKSREREERHRKSSKDRMRRRSVDRGRAKGRSGSRRRR